MAFARANKNPLLTTTWVLTEWADSMAAPRGPNERSAVRQVINLRPIRI